MDLKKNMFLLENWSLENLFWMDSESGLMFGKNIILANAFSRIRISFQEDLIQKGSAE